MIHDLCEYITGQALYFAASDVTGLSLLIAIPLLLTMYLFDFVLVPKIYEPLKSLLQAIWRAIVESFSFLTESDVVTNLRYGLLFILALSSLTVYSIILAGWSSNSKYAFIGALRSAAQMISYEVSITLILLPVGLLSGALNLVSIVVSQSKTGWFIFPLLPMALMFLVAMLAETNRTPFDLPEAEAELVAGYNVDFSSLPFAMFFLGEYSNMILISTLFCILFLGGWTLFILEHAFILVSKASTLWIFFVLVRASLPRYRYDQLMDIGWKTFLPIAGGYFIFVIGSALSSNASPVVHELFFNLPVDLPIAIVPQDLT